MKTMYLNLKISQKEEKSHFRTIPQRNYSKFPLIFLILSFFGILFGKYKNIFLKILLMQ